MYKGEGDSPAELESQFVLRLPVVSTIKIYKILRIFYKIV